MTRPREERRREYREAQSRYQPSKDEQRRYSSAARRPPRRRSDDSEYWRERADYPRPERPRGDRPYEDSRRRTPQRYAPPRTYEQRSKGYPSGPRPAEYHPPSPTYGERYPLQQAKKSTNQKILQFVSNLFFYVLTIGILVSAVLFAFSEKSDASILGYRFYQVLTDSMATQPDAPGKGFFSGDIVVVKLMNGTEVKEGEIVTFKVGNDGNSYLTHRMVEKLEELNGEKGDFLVTKGDANDTTDPPISADQVLGKVVFIIPKMGNLIAFVQENLWLCLVCVLSTFGFFLVLKAYFLQP